MNLAHDVYAETNPAYCTYAIVSFVRAYLSIKDVGPEMSVVYVAIPLAISGDLATLFEGTNKNTGLLEWLERSPEVQVGLAERINSSMDIVTDALRFGCFAGVISIADDTNLRLGSKKTNKSAINKLDENSAQAIKRAERLGYWLAMAGSTRNIFDSMGLTL